MSPRLLAHLLLLSICFCDVVNGQNELPAAAEVGIQVHKPKDPILLYMKRYLNVRRGLIKRTCELGEVELKNLDSIGEDWLKQEFASLLKVELRGISSNVTDKIRKA